jgi:nucleoside-diphosphate-sugar epimerase
MGDVRDLARAHILCLDAPPLTDGRHKRFLLSSKTFTWKELADLIRERRPELAHRLPSEDAVPTPTTYAPLDTSLATEVLGMTYIPWDETVLETLAAGLRWEEKYKGSA